MSRESAVNMARPPKRSVSAPRGIRATEPNNTGVATMIETCNGLNERRSVNSGANGDNRPHAQKLVVNAIVATVSAVYMPRRDAESFMDTCLHAW